MVELWSIERIEIFIICTVRLHMVVLLFIYTIIAHSGDLELVSVQWGCLNGLRLREKFPFFVCE